MLFKLKKVYENLLHGVTIISSRIRNVARFRQGEELSRAAAPFPPTFGNVFSALNTPSYQNPIVPQWYQQMPQWYQQMQNNNAQPTNVCTKKTWDIGKASLEFKHHLELNLGLEEAGIDRVTVAFEEFMHDWDVTLHTPLVP